VPILLLKLTLTPLLIGGASLAARRWGPSVGGWLVALPLTSGPVLLFLALDQGPAFAADAAVGTLFGLAAIAAFSLAYAAASPLGPLPAIGGAAGTFALVGLLLGPASGAPFAVLVGLVVGIIAIALRIMPVGSGAVSTAAHPGWDLPARLVVGTSLVVGLTTVAPLAGPVTSGLLATFPVYVSVLAVFSHLRDGRWGALGVLRGLLVGLFGTVAFYAVVRMLIVPAGVAATFAVAVAVTLAIQAVALRSVRPGAAEPV
jgi:hypothetical protein